MNKPQAHSDRKNSPSTKLRIAVYLYVITGLFGCSFLGYQKSKLKAYEQD